MRWSCLYITGEKSIHRLLIYRLLAVALWHYRIVDPANHNQFWHFLSAGIPGIPSLSTIEMIEHLI